MKAKHYEPLDAANVKTYPLASRPSKVRVEDSAVPWRAGGTFKAYLDTLPNHLAVQSLREVAQAIREARRKEKPVLLGMGAHVIKVGLSPILIDLVERGLVTAVALNGACAVHDFELATAGFTSEDVEAQLSEGDFGMAEETGRVLNEAALDGARRGVGFGRAVGDRLLAMRPPHLAHSLLAACARLDVPCTVHVALERTSSICTRVATGRPSGRRRTGTSACWRRSWPTWVTAASISTSARRCSCRKCS